MNLALMSRLAANMQAGLGNGAETLDQHRRPSGHGDQSLPDDSLIEQHTSEIPVVKAVDGRRPAPFVPDFSWRPGFDDYPVSLIQSSAAMRRRALVGNAASGDVPTLDDVVQNRTPARYIPHALAVAAIVAVIMSNGFWLNRSDAPSEQVDEPTTAIVDDTIEAEDPTPPASLLNRTQQPGQGGDIPDATPTAGDTADDVEESTLTVEGVPSPEPTATPAATRPMIPDPNVPSVTSTVAVPEAGVTRYNASEDETLIDIAGAYGLSVSSLLWPNAVSDPSEPLADGAEVIVPPVDGALHKVVWGDTVDNIAARYQVDPETILDFAPNQIGGSPSLRLGQYVMVPGGQITDWGEIQTYTVRSGDNLWLIADYYGLHPQSIAWANTLPRPELIAPGQVLDIPPGDGALIAVEAGDHVEAIAERYGVEPNAIRDYAFNNLGDGRVLQVGQKLLVPGAPLPEAESPSELNAGTVAGEGAFNPATGTFIWPSNGFVSQEFHEHHNGLDIANQDWTPVNAADGGIVIFAGWNDYGLGYAVGVDHGNGYQTWYGHLLNQPYVEVGQVVWQGGYLGPMGSTGKSTGPHLHFIVMKDGVYQNPLDYLHR
jgi:murein DD-endopeptidase MepM/ murein hydrolase activator NlpD